MASTSFTLPARRRPDGISYSKSCLARAFASSRACNPRNVEYLWYGFWNQVLMDLTSDVERLFVVPQHLLYFIEPPESESPPAIREHMQVGLQKEASISSIVSVAATTACKTAREIIPDFAVIRVRFRWRDEEKSKTSSNAKIQHAGVPLLVEIKRAGSRRATTMAQVFLHMHEAQQEAMTQAAFLFRMYPVQATVILMAGTGQWWTCRIAGRDEVAGREELDPGFVPEDETMDEAMEEGKANDDDDWALSDEELNKISANPELPAEFILLEPIVREEDLKIPTSGWTGGMRLETSASRQKFSLIHRRLSEVVADKTGALG